MEITVFVILISQCLITTSFGKKFGSNQLDIKKKLLECGGNNPARDMTSMNAAALTYMCMVQAVYYPLSSYCKRKRVYQFCKENAVNPAACERMDFNNPPLECLP